ncbi:undecaprenyl diphosphate synthetase [Campylobacter subantarcticus LMG 24377]|uniref:Isoprenyl transferase n=2 Tax=Campylobacter subantarcticus TaxID=497724 RepID=A0A0A8HAM2_9BACT|nr:polyprenyl diphosphate synthase [Campylobacter subantarcticus]EAJ1260459.1 di-trans,poly-cis-decaprenylcistransferase [Campylobacter lari]AJC90977.1 undecaprenyl diphosphate synthetase [Campylobacter subantarcticus LMG 24374]AJC92756.1 undecaprenyl diphosphate synthetase [Campylobacter subantarcticus LMG 24377]EAL3938179.1 di-trans,poly-cis-decaprenylcistransferase [Campylobacter lari]MPB99105.1 di-trans,poly-cis-decaprenylcistransferase [Campylobacter subantarcticus]
MNELKHLAVVMDGNRRWARKNGLLEKIGYSQGAKVVEKIIEVCMDEKIQNLTLYAFSTENWQRSKEEVEFLFKLLNKYLDESLNKFISNKVRFKAIGNLSLLDELTLKKIQNFQEQTKKYTKLCVNLAISYGSKDEIVRAVKKVIEKNLEINEVNIQANLDLSEDVDLFLRVGSAKRISNFLLWQSSYAEIYFSQTLFPALTKKEIANIIAEFKKRKRTFGK